MSTNTDMWEPMDLCNESAFFGSVGSLDIDDLSLSESEGEDSVADYRIDISHAFENALPVMTTSSPREIHFDVDVIEHYYTNISVKRTATTVRSPLPPLKSKHEHSAMETSAAGCRMASSAVTQQAHSTTSTEDLQAQYDLCLRQLALSMRRSEMTRQEISRQQRLSETQRKIVEAEAHTFSKADSFLQGSRTTLTVGLEQSRSMLQSYMQQLM